MHVAVFQYYFIYQRQCHAGLGLLATVFLSSRSRVMIRFSQYALKRKSPVLILNLRYKLLFIFSKMLISPSLLASHFLITHSSLTHPHWLLLPPFNVVLSQIILSPPLAYFSLLSPLDVSDACAAIKHWPWTSVPSCPLQPHILSLSLLPFLFCKGPPNPHYLLCAGWFYSRVSCSSHSTHFLSTVSSITVISASSHKLLLPKYPWIDLTSLPSKDGHFQQPTHWLDKLKSLRVLLEETNVELLCHMIQAAIVALGWPWENSLDLCNLFHHT